MRTAAHAMTLFGGATRNFKCLAPAKHFCGGGILLFLLSWASFAVLFGAVIGLENRMKTCTDPCHSSTFCWPSNLTSSSSMCVGDATRCLQKCMPETNISNDALNDGSSCRRNNKCDEIVRSESERVNRCELACDEANMYSAITPLQKVCFLLGLLIIVLSGTICLNFYREAIKCPPKCSPWYREVPGRVLLYGCVAWAIGLLIWIIMQLGELATRGLLGGFDFLYAVVFVFVMVFNLALVLSSWVGRCCLAEDTEDKASLDPLSHLRATGPGRN